MLPGSRHSTRDQGSRAELRAEHLLLEEGLQLVQRNFSCRSGEIDLIMRHGEQLVFVEVRYRKNALYGSALESVNRKKQQKLIATARYYLVQNKNQGANCRFDVVGITGNDIQWVPAAFHGI